MTFTRICVDVHLKVVCGYKNYYFTPTSHDGTTHMSRWQWRNYSNRQSAYFPGGSI